MGVFLAGHESEREGRRVFNAEIAETAEDKIIGLRPKMPNAVTNVSGKRQAPWVPLLQIDSRLPSALWAEETHMPGAFGTPLKARKKKRERWESAEVSFEKYRKR